MINGERYESISYDRKVDRINIANFDLGPKAGIIYHFTNKLAVEGTYYYGIGNVDSRVPKVEKLKVQQITVGLRYVLWINSKIQ